ncbi:uncharacterized protein LOC106644971 [Copidosoma floridanum]|uniref:uncharacterized protein LOC106644971 n=1 Tax=Copidosoma floridanum TaxID=29053 RepID=UPI0006C9A2FE|nr:uncharacterized protein LOC106644971 [Copidosoma floridanum]
MKENSSNSSHTTSTKLKILPDILKVEKLTGANGSSNGCTPSPTTSVVASPPGMANGNGSMTSSSSSNSSASSSTTTTTGGGVGVGSNGGGGGGGGARMAVIGVTRNVKLRRRGASGFGFSLRGGREYAAGFYVSDVVPGGEAHRNGLRVGDQILRVNGYPVEDAVHQEVALLAKNQQVLVLKIRSVGMIPVKDNPNDPVTWHMVQQQQQQLQFGDAVSNEIRIRVLVGEKGRLGCGVCRGLVPGLTVQGTREGGPARAAGLKTGDIIIWCNGVSLTDLPFERAIETMRNAAVLDLVVNRPIVNHVYDCPESLWIQRGSSGYDSESSGLVGPSPPPAHMQHQHPASPQHHRSSSDPRYGQLPCNRNGRNCCPPNGSGQSDWGHMEQSQEWTRKPNNTTVIRISQNHGTSNNPYASQQHQQYPTYHTHIRRGSAPRLLPSMMRSGANGAMYDDNNDVDEEPLYDPVAPKDFESHDFDANPRDELDRRAEYRREHGIREQSYEQAIDDVFNKVWEKTTSSAVTTQQQQTGDKDRKTVTTVEVHQPCPPAPPPPLPYKWPAETKPMNAMGLQMGSTMSMGSTGSTETESSLESSCGGKDMASTSSSLSTSSCEQQPMAATSFASSIAAAAACGASGKPAVVQLEPVRIQAGRPAGAATQTTVKGPPPPPSTIDLGTAITQELQRRAKQRSISNGANQDSATEKSAQNGQLESRKPQNPEALRAQEQKVTHDKLMEEFKRAHQRMFSNTQQRNQATDQQQQQQLNGEQNEEKCKNTTTQSTLPAGKKLATAKKTNGDEAVEMQSIESFKLKDSATAHVPKPPPTYFSFTSTDNNKMATTPESQNGAVTSKPLPSTSVSKAVSKVAIRIGTYEADSTKQPSKLGFLNQQRNGSKSKVEPPVASRLQNELVATLQRSNLRKKISGDNETTPLEEAETMSIQENDIASVDKLATVLSNKVTIRVNPETSSR